MSVKQSLQWQSCNAEAYLRKDSHSLLDPMRDLDWSTFLPDLLTHIIPCPFSVPSHFQHRVLTQFYPGLAAMDLVIHGCKCRSGNVKRCTAVCTLGLPMQLPGGPMQQLAQPVLGQVERGNVVGRDKSNQMVVWGLDGRVRTAATHLSVPGLSCPLRLFGQHISEDPLAYSELSKNLFTYLFWVVWLFPYSTMHALHTPSTNLHAMNWQGLGLGCLWH